MEWVVFTCGTLLRYGQQMSPHELYEAKVTLGSSNGRAPRCAAWFLEFVREVAADNDMQVMVLEGGVKGWVKAGPQFTNLMDGYKAEYWKDLFAEEDNGKRDAIGGPASDGKPAIGQGDVVA